MVCLETTFIIDVLKGDPKVAEFEDLIDREGSGITIASPTIMEIVKGIHLNRNKGNIKLDEERNINLLLNKSTILLLDRESAELAGKIDAELENKGESIGRTDIMIAAIAIKNNQTLVTRNKKHFENIPNLKIECY